MGLSPRIEPDMLLGSHEKISLGFRPLSLGLFWKTNLWPNVWSLSHTIEPLWSREGNLALGNRFEPSGSEIPACPQSHRHILRSSWMPRSIVTRQTENLVNSLGTSKQSQGIKADLCHRSGANTMWVSRHPFGELCYRIFLYGDAGAPYPAFPSHAEGRLAVWSRSQAPAWESLQVFWRPPDHSWAIMDTNCSVSRHLTPALPQVLENSKKLLQLELSCPWHTT